MLFQFDLTMVFFPFIFSEYFQVFEMPRKFSTAYLNDFTHIQRNIYTAKKKKTRVTSESD